MNTLARNGILGIGLCLASAGLGGNGTLAASFPVIGAEAAVAAPQATPVGWRDDGYHHRHARRGHFVAPVVTGYGRPYYGYNRYSGQYYRSCVFDEGYGRVRNCDAGR